MKRTMTAFMMTILLGSVSKALAASGGTSEEMGFLTILFIGFFALIVVLQLIPGLSLLFSMLSSLFSSEKATREEAVVRDGSKK